MGHNSYPHIIILITVILTSLSRSAMRPTVYQDLECFATEAVFNSDSLD